MKMKDFKKSNIKIGLVLLSIGLLRIVTSCSAFLDYNPKGELSSEQLQPAEEADALVTAADAAIGNDDWAYAFTHQWVIGSIRSDDAYKGGGSVPDQGEYDRFEQFYNIQVGECRMDILG